jgi:phosphatidylinositol glycan class A protein
MKALPSYISNMYIIKAFLGVVPFMFVCTFPLVREILVRERVDIVHGHQAPSMLAHEVMLHASTMGLKTVYTDHSLYQFQDTVIVYIIDVLFIYVYV